MKVCYCDESGTGNEPIAVMVGVVVDSQRMHVTKDHWRDLLASLSRIVGTRLFEIHTREFYAGNGVWRNMAGPERSNVISEVFEWLQARKHHIVYSSVVKQEYLTSFKAGQIPAELDTVWRFLGLHLLLSIQRHFQKQAKTKGHTIFIFDNEEKERVRFTDLVANPPAWSHTYYTKRKKQSPLDQIIDVPYFGDSKEVPLLQVADFIAYFLRRYAEINDAGVPARYPHEVEKISGWIKIPQQCSIPAAAMYPASGRCECSETFYAHAPISIRDLQRA
jgi:hypothetical protein